MRRTARLTLLTHCLLATAAVAQHDDPLAAHRLIADAAVHALPSEIAPWFQAHLTEFRFAVDAPARDWPKDAQTRKRNRWHRVEVDGGIKSQDQAARREALRNFPRTRAQAHRAYRQHGRRRGGELPWAIDECFQRLIIAFRQSNEAEIIRSAGHLTHFVADAANPFNVTANDRGTLTGNPTFGIARGPHPDSAKYSVRERFFVGLINRHTGELTGARTLEPDDFEPILDPTIAAFNMIEDSLSLVDEIAGHDRRILTELNIIDRDGFERLENEYFERLAEGSLDLARDRIQRGAIVSAGLIGGAWRLAGAPPVGDFTPEPLVTAKDESAPAAQSRQDELLGSRNSDVFHVASCPFAARISQKNRVTFASVDEAEREGRRPCKQCLDTDP